MAKSHKLVSKDKNVNLDDKKLQTIKKTQKFVKKSQKKLVQKITKSEIK